jgi:DNA-binding transcriptional LysR family regulator
MEIRHLRYFVAIAEERSFTRAAERLWVAQPGLSTQIRRLEAELGVRLFDRHTRGVDLTDAGVLFLERARAALAAADLARATGQDLQSGVVGSLRLGLSTEAQWAGAAGLLETFNRDRPAIEVTVVESHGGTVIRDLRDGRLDAVLAPAMYGSADLRSIELGHEPWVALVGCTHRLAGEGPVTADDLRGERIVVTGHRDGAGYDRAVAETLAELGVAAALQRGGPGPALLASVAGGETLALTAGPAALGSGVVARPLEPVRALSFELLWRAEAPSPALSELIDASQRLPRRSRPRPAPALVAVA